MMNEELELAKKIYFEYKDSCSDFIKQAKEKSVYQKYGFGGELLHRGYFCPSLVQDLILGNANRGRILNNPSTKISTKPYTYKFGFDAKNKLTYIENDMYFEFINYKSQLEIGVQVDKTMEINTLSICSYNGKQLGDYVFCLCNPFDDSILQITKEQYTYNEDELLVDMFLWCSKVKQHSQIVFSVENGYLTSYTVRELDENDRLIGYSEGYRYKVAHKRKLAI